MRKPLLRTQDAVFEPLIQESLAFHGQEIHADIGPSIARKRPTFRIIFAITSFVSRNRLANALMVLAVVLGYRIIREPDGPTEVYQFGISDNNVAAFQRLNRCLDPQTRSGICINGRSIPFGVRLRVALSLKRIWQAGGVLRRNRHPDPFVHLQSVLAAAAAVMFLKRPLGDDLLMVCIACDHSPIVMALLAAARRQGKVTCYLQHAPVTEHFPPLTFDLSILYDRASTEAYRLAARRCDVGFDAANVVLLPPFEEAFRSPKADLKPYRIGLCLSYFPNMSRLEELIASLSARPEVGAVCIRRHPRCLQDWSTSAVLPKVELRPRGEDANRFFGDVDVVLVPNSGVAVEALHHGCPTFYLPGADPFPDDYYGFVAEGILPVFSLGALDDPTAFFDAEWQKRFTEYDESASAELDDLRSEASSAFMSLLKGQHRIGVFREPLNSEVGTSFGEVPSGH